MESYFSRTEDEAFTRLVLEYNALGEDAARKRELAERIRERTMILLYLIPQRSLDLPAEDAGAFLLSVENDIWRMITSFHLSGLTYNGYLTKICRYRCMRYGRKKMQEQNTETGMTFSDLSVFEEVREAYIPYSAGKETGSDAMDMPALIDFIIRNPGKTDACLSAAERKIAELLRNPKKRRQFISFILSLPEVESPGFIADISRVLCTDISAVARFYMLRHEMLLKASEENRRKLEDKAGRHWKVLVRLRQKIAAEGDAEKSDEMKEKYMRLEKTYRRRLSELRRTYSGFTQTEIAGILGIPRSSVTHDIHSMRKALEKIAGEKRE